jgi:hypothetical protein
VQTCQWAVASVVHASEKVQVCAQDANSTLTDASKQIVKAIDKNFFIDKLLLQWICADRIRGSANVIIACFFSKINNKFSLFTKKRFVQSFEKKPLGNAFLRSRGAFVLFTDQPSATFKTTLPT